MRPRGPIFWFVMTDLATLVFSFELAWLLFVNTYHYPGSATHPSDIHLRIFALVWFTPFVVLGAQLAINGLFRLYDFIHNSTEIDILYLSIWAVLFGTLFEVLFLSYVKVFYIDTTWRVLPVHGNPEILDVQISRQLLAYGAVFTFVGMVAWRWLYLRRRRRYGYDLARVLIVGYDDVGRGLENEIETYSAQGHVVVGYVDDQPSIQSERLLGRVDDIPRVVHEAEVDEIVIVSQRASRWRLMEILSLCHDTDCTLWLMPDLYETIVGEVDCQMAGIPLIQLSSMARRRRLLGAKRVIDFVIALAVVLCCALPALVICALIKLTSRGKIIFGQERIGQHGVPFTLYKFRTMREDAEEASGPVLATPDDPRITRMGRVLRRYHLDEWPQFWNVLRGDMSLVGPRPERPMFVEQFQEEIPAYRLRFEAKPGLTGLAQVYGHYASSVNHKLRYDISYIHNFSPLLDLKVLLATLLYMATGQRPRGL